MSKIDWNLVILCITGIVGLLILSQCAVQVW